MRQQRIRPLAVAWRTCVWMTLVAFVTILMAAVVVPRVAGATPYAIMTGSMQPQYPPGTLVIVKSKDMAQLRTGDIITYQVESGQPTVVTHRVIGQGLTAAGNQYVTTKGDANNVADAEPVRPVQIRGELWYALPYLGYANDLITPKDRHVVLIGAVGVLLMYAAVMFASAARDRLRPVGVERGGQTDV